MKRVLILPCATQIAKEQYESLKYNKHFDLIGASHNNSDSIFSNFIKLTCPKDDVKFIKEVIKIINEHNIDILLPAHDDILYILKNSTELQSLIPGSGVDTINICRFKSKTYAKLKRNKLLTNTIPEYTLIKNVPIFFKPDRGQGSRGSFKLNEEYISCEYLPGDEYTIDCFTDIKGKLSYINPRLRAKIINGISEVTELTSPNEFKLIAEQINKTLKLRGAWFFQMKRDKNNSLKLLEVAPRIAGASTISRLNGVNLTALSLYQHLGYKINVVSQCLVDSNNRLNPKYNLNYDSIFVDYDDTYPYVINELKKLNKLIKVITRNKTNLNLPYETIYVKDNELKSDIINNQIKKFKLKPIFIDDSFKEKKDVYLNCKIPCISLEEVLYLNI